MDYCIVFIGLSTLFLLAVFMNSAYTFNKQLKDLREQVSKKSASITELQHGMAMAQRFMSTQRQSSMNAAIQDATKNPEKYLEGSYFIKEEEKPKND